MMLFLMWAPQEEYKAHNDQGVFDWSGVPEEVFRKVVPHMGVDTIFINSGLWLEMTDRNEVLPTLSLATRLA